MISCSIAWKPSVLACNCSRSTTIVKSRATKHTSRGRGSKPIVDRKVTAMKVDVICVSCRITSLTLSRRTYTIDSRLSSSKGGSVPCSAIAMGSSSLNISTSTKVTKAYAHTAPSGRHNCRCRASPRAPAWARRAFASGNNAGALATSSFR